MKIIVISMALQPELCTHTHARTCGASVQELLWVLNWAMTLAGQVVRRVKSRQFESDVFIGTVVLSFLVTTHTERA